MRKFKPERGLQNDMLVEAQKQGFWTSNTNDIFISGKPDFRLSRADVGQMDFELKVLDIELSTIQADKSVQTGLTKLQFNELRDMNLAGAPAVGLVYVVPLSVFIFCNEREARVKFSMEFWHTDWFTAPRERHKFDFAHLMRAANRYLQVRKEVDADG